MLRRMRIRSLPALALAALLGAAGCKTYPVNRPLAGSTNGEGYYFHNQNRPENSGETLLVLAFSGGGTRAAAFSFGVLEALRDIRITVDGRERPLLQEVDAISSVSGGSVTAAAYGLLGDATFNVLEEAFLKRNVQGDLARRVINPFRWPALWSSTYGRSDLAADYYDQILFAGATFADLQRSRGPFILLNASDLTTGARFDFSQYTFDLLCSDLQDYRVSRAVAASSAVPGLLTPITLRNYGGGCGHATPEWITREYEEADGRIRLRADELRTYLNRTNRPYLHLVDGGVSDNLGLRPLLDIMGVVERNPALQADLKVGNVKRVVIISANARSAPEKDWDRSPKPPNSVVVAAAAASHTLDRYSMETMEVFRSEFARWQRSMGGSGTIQLYPVMLSFSKFKDPQRRNFFLNLPTSFFLPKADVDQLRAAGRELLAADPLFQQLLRDLGAATTAAAE
ncbi:MAG TPA: patatin [Verrucomicrobiales bacterium]|nr:patatin [Verrucomicrobiales bacterium]